MKTMTSDEVLKLYLRDRSDKKNRLALEILTLKNESAIYRLKAALQSNLIDEKILNEFSYRCAKRALSQANNPDPRSVWAIKVKYAWMKGEATDEELAEARDTARMVAYEAAWEAELMNAPTDEAEWDVERAATKYAEKVAETVAWATETAAWAVEHVVWAARSAAGFASWKARRVAEETEIQWQIEELKRMLKAGEAA